MAKTWMTLLSVCVTGLCATQAWSQNLEFYLPAAQAPPGSVTQHLKLSTGEPVDVAAPPVATVPRSSVVGARGMIVPVSVEKGAEQHMPDPHLYRVAFDLTDPAQAELQQATDRYCSSGADLQIAVNGTIISHVVLLGCGSVFEAGASFVNRTDAEKFAQQFTASGVHFVPPSPSPPAGKL